ncbi:LemA family protein [Lutibacter maritimus]|uniref:LemA family protein n=2 Tax=Lutibacter maritimus TaxID=593133 RepID=A0A1I6SZ61_9FLAO|nr:LemA family protein [Lutibacter maritimus]
MPNEIEKLNLSNDFKIDSLRMDKYFSYQRKLSGLIVKSILTLEQYSNLETDKKANKKLDKLAQIEEELKVASKQYNQLIDENDSFKDYPRIGGTKKTEIDFDINFD